MSREIGHTGHAISNRLLPFLSINAANRISSTLKRQTFIDRTGQFQRCSWVGSEANDLSMKWWLDCSMGAYLEKTVSLEFMHQKEEERGV